MKAVYSAINADAAFQASGFGLHMSTAPNETDPPYITIQGATSIPFDTKGQYGMEHTITLNIWTNSETDYEGKVLTSELYRILHDIDDLGIIGFNTVLAKFEFEDSFPDPSENIFHHVMRFRFIVDEV